MADSIVAIVSAEVRPGSEDEFLRLSRELFELIRRKGYGHDRLIRSTNKSNLFFDIRDWASGDAADRAHSDPEIHALWARLDRVCAISHVVGSAREVRP
jgi:quinol monooxygenase YgiN